MSFSDTPDKVKATSQSEGPESAVGLADGCTDGCTVGLSVVGIADCIAVGRGVGAVGAAVERGVGFAVGDAASTKDIFTRVINHTRTKRSFSSISKPNTQADSPM